LIEKSGIRIFDACGSSPDFAGGSCHHLQIPMLAIFPPKEFDVGITDSEAGTFCGQ
jgi:hypothetical protein